MKTFPGRRGPFAERPFYTQEEIERTCTAALKSSGLYPSSPGPVRIERFVEKYFGVTPTYEDLPEGVLGFTRFGANGVESVFVSKTLAEEGSRVAERRLNSTLAHEAGHGLLHAHLFVVDALGTPLFGEMENENKVKVLCREEIVGKQEERKYDGRWWEYQANKAIGSLLLPKLLIIEVLQPFLTKQGSLGQSYLLPAKREEAAKTLASTFEVNPVVARIRMNELYPFKDTSQLTL